MPIQEIYFGVTSLLTCTVDRGNPLATIEWLYITSDEDGDEVIETIAPDWNPRFTVVDGGLQIENVQASDEGLYRCYVSNDYDIVELTIQAAFRG